MPIVSAVPVLVRVNPGTLMLAPARAGVGSAVVDMSGRATGGGDVAKAGAAVATVTAGTDQAAVRMTARRLGVAWVMRGSSEK
ncbi:hypothetical protein GCM10007231_03240 [Nocardioides daphniae]|uniref:Uncharacterized protein n=1 Tax=Nocardioides daphniae TaxID=402297 RepID=A0ABQ1PZR1_9ACTN|nr:hypothetical protein GCM10007231_03240 [Nocardioides daphniae]